MRSEVIFAKSATAKMLFVATIYISLDTRCAGSPRENPFRFSVIPGEDLSGTPARILSPEIVSASRSDEWRQQIAAALAWGTSKSPRLRKKKRIFDNKRRKEMRHARAMRKREGREGMSGNETRSETVGSTNSETTIVKEHEKNETRLVPEINRSLRYNLAQKLRTIRNS